MKAILLAVSFLLMLLAPTQGNAAVKGGVGAVLTRPLTAGVYGTLFPVDDLSIDGWLTTTTADLGLTGHIPVYKTLDNRHSVLLTGMAGYTHNEIVQLYRTNSYRAVLAAGYGFQTNGGLDLRGLLGADIFGTHPSVEARFHAHVMVGYLF